MTMIHGKTGVGDYYSMTTMMTTKSKESSCDDEDESAPDLNAPLTLRLLLLLPLLVFLRSPDHALMLLFCDDNGNTSHKLQRQMLIMWRGNDHFSYDPNPNPNHCDYSLLLGKLILRESECGLKIIFFFRDCLDVTKMKMHSTTPHLAFRLMISPRRR